MAEINRKASVVLCMEAENGATAMRLLWELDLADDTVPQLLHSLCRPFVPLDETELSLYKAGYRSIWNVCTTILYTTSGYSLWSWLHKEIYISSWREANLGTWSYLGSISYGEWKVAVCPYLGSCLIDHICALEPKNHIKKNSEYTSFKDVMSPSAYYKVRMNMY